MRSFLHAILPGLAILLLIGIQWSAHSKLIWQGYPYETWDEIGSSNNSAVLDEPETLRVYSYGSLDSFLHIIAHFYYQKFDDLGKRHLRHSFANNVPQSLNDPFYIYGPRADPNALDYNYFRGLNDREVIFQARKLYLLVVYGLILLINVLILSQIGWRGLPASLAVLTFTCAPMFSTQAALALPNAINPLLIIAVSLAAVFSISNQDIRWLLLASALTACGVNMKLDFASMGLVTAIAGCLTWYRARWAFSVALRKAAANLGVFICFFILTRPMVLVRPLGEWQVQYRMMSNIVSAKADSAANFKTFTSFLATELFGITDTSGAALAEALTDPQFPLILLCLVTIIFLILRILSRQDRTSSSAGKTSTHLPSIPQNWSVAFLLLFTASLLWWIPVSRSVQLYARYFLYGLSVWWLFVGLSLTQALFCKRKTALALGWIGVFLLCALYASRAAALIDRKNTMVESYSTLAGLDPAHSRNRLSFQAVQQIMRGGYEREILVDQHSYTDLRFFWINNIRTRYINMLNYETVFDAIKDGKRRLIFFAPADGGGGEDLIKYNKYRDFLMKFPAVAKIPGHRMSTLNPAPVVPTDEVVLLAAN